MSGAFQEWLRRRIDSSLDLTPSTLALEAWQAATIVERKRAAGVVLTKFPNCQHDGDDADETVPPENCDSPCHNCCSDCNHEFIAAAILKEPSDD